jgi:S-layer homology domain
MILCLFQTRELVNCYNIKEETHTMAYQSKSNRKFLATSLTAAMVASAVAPAASAASTFPDVKEGSFYYEYVSALAEAGIIDGRPDGSFDLGGKLNRAEAAKMISKIIKLDTTDAPASSFEDVKEDVWYTDYINALYAEGLIDGVSEKMFAPNQELTRAQLAKLVVDAYGLELDASAEHPFTDVKEDVWYTDYIKTLYKHGLIDGKTATTFAPNEPIKRADFAKLLTEADWAVGDTLAKPAAMVSSVSAVNATTLKIEGTSLQNLKVEDLSLDGNKVLSVTSSDDGKTATVTLETAITPNKEYVLNVMKDGAETPFKFTFGYVVTSVSVDEVTLDNDTKYQTVPFKVNGQSADLETLISAGYSVSFKAVKGNTDVTSSFFADATTGDVNDAVAIDDYKVQVTVTKGSDVVVSELQTVKVRNLQGLATAVNSYELTNTAVADVQNSTTLVVGETASVTKINVTANGDKTNVTDSTKYSVKSSAPGVISVNSTTGALSANAPGTATITISYGDVSKSITFTVTNTARKTNNVVPYSSSVTLIKDAAPMKTVGFEVYDQYGDLVKTPSAISVVAPGNATAGTVTAANGTGTVALTYAANGTGTLYFKNSANTTLGTVVVKSTSTNTVSSQKLEVVKAPSDPTRSDDNSLDLYADTTVRYNLNNYTSENAKIGAADLAGYSVKYNASIVKINGSTGTTGSVTESLGSSSLNNLDIVANAKGSTEVALYDASNVLVGKMTITVTDSEPEITGVNFKSVPTVTNTASTVNVKSVLSTTAGAIDDVVSGITLSKSSMHETRIVKSGTNVGKLYVDLNDDGQYVAAEDDLLGEVTMEKASDFTGNTAAISDVYTGYTSASSDEGTLVFKVLDENGTIVASTSVSVDVQ